MPFIQHLHCLNRSLFFFLLSGALSRMQWHTSMRRMLLGIPLIKAEDSRAAPYLVLRHVIHHHLEEQGISTAVTTLQPSFPNKLHQNPDASIPKSDFQPSNSHCTHVQLEVTSANVPPWNWATSGDISNCDIFKESWFCNLIDFGLEITQLSFQVF